MVRPTDVRPVISEIVKFKVEFSDEAEASEHGIAAAALLPKERFQKQAFLKQQRQSIEEVQKTGN
jgi:hypothetical protein